MPVLQHESQQYNTVALLKAMTSQPKDNDKFFCEENNLYYDYDPTNTDPDN